MENRRNMSRLFVVLLILLLCYYIAEAIHIHRMVLNAPGEGYGRIENQRHPDGSSSYRCK